MTPYRVISEFMRVIDPAEGNRDPRFRQPALDQLLPFYRAP